MANKTRRIIVPSVPVQTIDQEIADVRKAIIKMLDGFHPSDIKSLFRSLDKAELIDSVVNGIAMQAFPGKANASHRQRVAATLKQYQDLQHSKLKQNLAGMMAR